MRLSINFEVQHTLGRMEALLQRLVLCLCTWRLASGCNVLPGGGRPDFT